MDDASIKVRISVCEGLKALFLNTSKDYGTQFSGQVQYVYSVLLLHLDDDDASVKKAVTGNNKKRRDGWICKIGRASCRERV